MKMFCKVDNGIISSYPIIESNLTAAIKGWDSENPELFGYKEIHDNPPTELAPNEHAHRGNFAIDENGVVAYEYTIIKETAEDLMQNLIKNRRNLMLARSDWTQTVDAPLTSEKKEAWAAYRQALRDMPQNYPEVDFDTEIEWPVEPN